MNASINPSAGRIAAGQPRGAAKAERVEKSRLRLLPLTMSMLALLLVVKTNDIYFTAQALRNSLVSSAEAKEEAKPEDGEKAKSKEGDDKKKEEKKKPEPPKVSASEIKALKKLEAQTKYSQIELDLLHNLAKRRDELDVREKDLALKATVLEATEKRIDGRIEEMKELQGKVALLIKSYKEQQDSDVRSLVKIYENMKPANAASIFNELDMAILLSVIDKMSERKVAPVLAAMSPKRAKDVTEELAALRKATALPTNAESAAPSP